MHTCPRCRKRLTRAKTRAGIVHTCDSCGGRAVGIAVVRKATYPKHAKELWNRAREGRASALHCPVCRHPMTEVPLPLGAAAVVLDVCRRCQFVWFDGSEFEQLPAPELPTTWRDRLPEDARERIALTHLAADASLREAAGSDGESTGDAPDEPWKLLPALLGFPVEHEAEPLQSLPWVTWTLMAVLVVVFLATVGDIRGAADDWGFIPDRAFRHGGLTLLTCFFLHAGWWHLVGNAYFLLVFGDNVEDCLGWRRYVLLILGATIAGAAVHALADPRDVIPCIGASGGISGIIVFYALRFPQARLGIAVRYGIAWRYTSVPAYGALVFWILLQLWMAHRQIAGFSSVSALAHLGGAMGGLAAWLAWQLGSRAVADPVA